MPVILEHAEQLTPPCPVGGAAGCRCLRCKVKRSLVLARSRAAEALATLALGDFVVFVYEQLDGALLARIDTLDAIRKEGGQRALDGILRRTDPLPSGWVRYGICLFTGGEPFIGVGSIELGGAKA